jgi:hypothetical protein
LSKTINKRFLVLKKSIVATKQDNLGHKSILSPFLLLLLSLLFRPIFPKRNKGNVVYHRADHITERIIFPYPTTLKLQHAFSQLFNIEIQTQETRIILAIEAIRSSKKLSKYRATKIYKILYTTLSYKIASRTYCPESKTNCYKLTDLKEDTIVRYILDLDSRGFAPRLASVKNIANLLLESRGVLCVGKN